MTKEIKWVIIRFFIIPTFVLILCVFITLNIPIATLVEIKLKVKNLDFTINSSNLSNIRVLNGFQTQKLTLLKFDKLKFTAKLLEVANPSQYNFSKNNYPVEAWRKLYTKDSVLFKAQPLNPHITINGFDSTAKIGIAPVITNSNSKFQISIFNLNWSMPNIQKTCLIKVSITGDPITENFDANGMMYLNVQNCKSNIVASIPFLANANTFRLLLSESNPVFQARSSKNIFAYSFRANNYNDTSITLSQNISVNAINFTEPDPQTGSLESTLFPNSIATVSYPKMPKAESLVFDSHSIIELEPTSTYYIKSIIVPSSLDGFVVDFVGKSKQIFLRTGNQRVDLRKNVFIWLYENPFIITITGLILWFIPVLFGIYKFVKSFSGKQN
ncbi:MAG TPA: hypothetical protein VE978_19750 [Chitinophagales bacterium]|nr:hypothetical protein [Chitinophagales bacterium]